MAGPTKSQLEEKIKELENLNKELEKENVELSKEKEKSEIQADNAKTLSDIAGKQLTTVSNHLRAITGLIALAGIFGFFGWTSIDDIVKGQVSEKMQTVTKDEIREITNNALGKAVADYEIAFKTKVDSTLNAVEQSVDEKKLDEITIEIKKYNALEPKIDRALFQASEISEIMKLLRDLVSTTGIQHAKIESLYTELNHLKKQPSLNSTRKIVNHIIEKRKSDSLEFSSKNDVSFFYKMKFSREFVLDFLYPYHFSLAGIDPMLCPSIDQQIEWDEEMLHLLNNWVIYINKTPTRAFSSKELEYNTYRGKSDSTNYRTWQSPFPNQPDVLLGNIKSQHSAMTFRMSQYGQK